METTTTTVRIRVAPRFNPGAPQSVPIQVPAVQPTTTTAITAPIQSPSTSLDFGGLNKKPKVAKVGKQYPILPDPAGNFAAIAQTFLDAEEREKSATGDKETARADLIVACRRHHFERGEGLSDVPSTVEVISPNGTVQVTFKNSYRKCDSVGRLNLVRVLGETLANRYLKQSFEFTIKSDLIPAEKLQTVIDEVRALSAKLNIGNAVSVDACFSPVPEFHSARYREMSVEQNMALELAADPMKGYCSVAVKRK